MSMKDTEALVRLSRRVNALGEYLDKHPADAEAQAEYDRLRAKQDAAKAKWAAARKEA